MQLKNIQKGQEGMEDKAVVFATSNPHKVDELNKIMEGSGLRFILPDEGFDPKEEGETFLSNSYSKAYCASVCEKRGYNLFLADDSGLCVRALNWGPGIYSARYDKTPELRIKKILKNMEGIEDRYAYFICAITLCDKEGKIICQTEGKCEGEIGYQPSGKNGFGYDPVFLPNGYNGLTMADLDEGIKNKISHRARALTKFKEEFKKNYQG